MKDVLKYIFVVLLPFVLGLILMITSGILVVLIFFVLLPTGSNLVFNAAFFAIIFGIIGLLLFFLPLIVQIFLIQSVEYLNEEN